jgi:acetyl esterase
MVVERDVVYRRDSEREWHAQVYSPGDEDADVDAGVGAQGAADGGSPRRPLLIDIHGGAWSGGNRFAGKDVDRVLVERLGIVVVAIDFRIAPADPYPAMMQDVSYAVRWVKAHAAELAGRSDGVGAIGWSSGGHMAVLAALKPGDPRFGAIPLEGGADTNVTVDAYLDYVVACWPPLDPRARYRFAQATGRAELVRNTEGCFGDETGMWEASAERVVASGEATAKPPLLIVQGTADGNIPLPMIERFAETYRGAGGDVQLELYDGQPHGFIMRPVPPEEDAERAMSAITEFVGRHARGRGPG